ncbi:MAG: CRISPR-associated endonuclease Cas2 [Thermoplasmata archaeon]
MYAIIVYDVAVERINNVRGFLKQLMNWVQNSVFEGELTESEFMRVQKSLNEIIDKDEDHIIIYLMAGNKYLNKVELGTPKSEISNIL